MSRHKCEGIVSVVSFASANAKVVCHCREHATAGSLLQPLPASAYVLFYGREREHAALADM